MKLPGHLLYSVFKFQLFHPLPLPLSSSFPPPSPPPPPPPVSNALQYEHMFMVTEDYPPGEESMIFRAGDRILAIGDTSVRGKTPEEFGELLQTEAVKGTTVRIVPRLSPPPSASSSLELPEKKLVRRTSEQQLLDSITMKVANLLSMRTCG